MRILLINHEYPPIGAGAANATCHIARCLALQGHTVFVLTSCFENLKGWRTEDGIQVFRCRTSRKKASQSNLFEMLCFVLSASFVLPGLLRGRKIDAMIAFFSFPCGPLGIWGKFVSGTPYIISLRGGDVPGNEPSLKRIHKLLQPMRRLIFRESLAIVANSEGLKVLSEKADPFVVEVIPNGVDADFFIPSSKAGQTRFLFVGRFQDQKNIFFLLKQMDAVAQKVEQEFELHLVGDGPLEYASKEYAAKLSMHDRIFWHGWCSKEEIREHYQHAYCILNPSVCEGMPNVVLEAMACGLPIIASNVAGNDAVIRHGETGFLFDLTRPEEFRKTVVQILQNKELARMMGQKGRAWAENAFSWDSVADGYLRLIKD